MAALNEDYVDGFFGGTHIDITSTAGGEEPIAILVASSALSATAFKALASAAAIPTTAMCRRSASTAGTKTINGVYVPFLDLGTVSQSAGLVTCNGTSPQALDAPDEDQSGLSYDTIVFIYWDTNDAGSLPIAYLPATAGVQTNGADINVTFPTNGDLFQIPLDSA